MASSFDDTEFVDSEFQVRKANFATAPSLPAPQSGAVNPGGTGRPPTREELEAKVNLTQQRLAELKRAQEDLERERAALEEARRRRVEFQTGREELIQHLTRGAGLLEEAEFAARRDAEQMGKTLTDLREALAKVQGINEGAWTQENYNVELTRALTTIENARMEWNGARLKWPLLNGSATAGQAPAPGAVGPLGATRSFSDLCRLGLALTWPLVLLGLGIFLLLLTRR